MALALAIAAYAPFNVDGQEAVGPFLFGADETSQQAGYQCYLNEVAKIDTTELEREVTETNHWLELSDAEALAARQAVATCLSADSYRQHWIDNHVWGWNTYARDYYRQPELTSDDPCFDPVFDTAEAFVTELVERGRFDRDPDEPALIGPFDCRASVGSSGPTPVPTPPSHPWYECEFFDYALVNVIYRVTNIAADDPDGGLVAHTSPGVGTPVTEVLPDGTDELRITGCQQNPSSGNVWWFVDRAGWVNAAYLESYSPFGSPDWQPGMTSPLPSDALPDVIGLEADTLAELTDLVRNAVAFENFTQIDLGNFQGVDARGGIARLDITNVGDDSINGFRMQLTIDFLKDETATDIIGYRIVSATGRAICSRGVTADGELCV